MNRAVITLCVFFVALFPALGDEGSYAASLGTRIGMLYSTSYEIIYIGTGSPDYTSELQWTTNPLLFAGLSVMYGPRNPLGRAGFFAGLEAKIGIPGTWGTVEDRDWLLPGIQTHYSFHDNHTKTAVLVDLEGGLSLPLLNRVFLRLHVGISYMFFDYEARNGYTQYGSNAVRRPYSPWDSGWSKVPIQVQGTGIGYSQHWLIFRPGLELVFRSNRVSFFAAMFISPLFGGGTFDNHYWREPPFLVEGSFSNGLFLEPKASISCALTAHCDIGLSLSYRHIGEIRGDIEQSEYYPSGTVTRKYADIAGAAYKAFEGALTFSYTF
jgi:outer membrane protease